MADQHVANFRINQRELSATVETDQRLADFVRDQLGLTGTNQACDTAQCGACTVLVDGLAVKACNVLALQVQGREITTIEGLQHGAADSPAILHPMQAAFAEHEALQCGYCTPGMILRAISMHKEGVPLTEASVREALSGNLCRCTGYDSIVRAILDGLKRMQQV